LCDDNAVCEYLYGLCPIGYKCAAGESHPVACEAGTYQALTGQPSCNPCPVGKYCNGGEAQPVICPAGSYCPIGTKYFNEFPCQTGTYSTSTGLQAQTACTLCAAGSYCTSASGTPDGLCAAGYYCQGGAQTDKPVANVVHGTYNNDECAAGKYCMAGSTGETDCPPGRASSTRKIGSLEGCSLCAAGYYCPNAAQTMSTDICPVGSYCPTGTAQPNQAPSAICPKGSRCIAQSVDHELCPGGSYQDVEGEGSCKICSAGYYCPIGAVAEILCPVGRYCPPNVAIGFVCDSGTYTVSTGLTLQSQCTSCPETKYCDGGDLLGICAAGYFCKGGSGSATPTVDLSAYVTIVSQYDYLLTQNNAQCPPGHYCPQGTLVPVQCPDTKVYQSTHASAAAQCTECPAGTKCIPGNPVPQDCDLGYYCPFSEPVTPCPVGRYGATVGLKAAPECTVCPAGFSCNAPGCTSSNYTQYPCEVGKYCPGGGSIMDCPAGTYVSTTGHSAVSDCLTCPQYKYCPPGSSTPLNCPAGMYCSVNSESGIFCPPGTYCPEFSLAPVNCPTSYYCAGATNQALPCPIGTYCPLNTAQPLFCPLGYIGIDPQGVSISHLATLATACSACPAGKYGSDPDRLLCSPGTAGYVFYGGTTGPTPTSTSTDKGEICPKGHFCPASSAIPIACDAGYFQPELGASSIAACLACAPGTYQHMTGKATCLPCSSSATSNAGALECSCVGGNRSFQPSDGRCICNPGYEFVDSTFEVSSENDGAYDCQPVVYARCNTAQTRNANGDCVDSETYCFTVCGGSGGKISASTGICECNIVTPLEAICDQTCRDAAPQVTCGGVGVIKIFYPGTGVTRTMPASEYTASSGKIDCSVANAKIATMSTTSGGFAGVFGAPSSITSQISRRLRRLADMENLMSNNDTSSARRLDDFSNEDLLDTRRLSVDPVISNPAVCLNVGDSIVFSISAKSYPVYVKDSLLNTNGDFDYSAFRTLDRLATTSTLTLSSFVFTFATAGTYVFRLSDAPESLTVMSILPSAVSCGIGSSFAELSGGTLITMGVKTSTQMVLGPDWPLVIGLVVGMLFLIILVVCFLYYFRKRAWPSHRAIPIAYRADIKKGIDLDVKQGGIFSCLPCGKGKHASVHPSLDEESGELDRLIEDGKINEEESKDVDFDDDMLIPELARHMQAQHDDVAKKLEKSKTQMDGLQGVLTKEIDELKALLNATAMQMSSAGGSEASKAKKLRAILLDVKKTTQDRSHYMSTIDLFNSKFKVAMGGLEKLITDGADASADAIVHEILECTRDAYEKDVKGTGFLSITLDSLLTDLAELVDLDKQNKAEADAEKRRVGVADKEFKEALNNARVIFPQNVLDLMELAAEAATTEDDVTSNIVGLLHSFAERTPKFSYAIESARGIFGRAILNDIQMGNDAAIETDLASSKKEMVSYLEDLLAAMALVNNKMGARMQTAVGPRTAASEVRTELNKQIDIELGFLPSMDMNGDIAKLVRALQKGGLPVMGGGDDEEAGEQREYPQSIKSSRVKSADGLPGTAIDDDVIDEVVNNDDLTLIQKEEALEKAQAERNMVESQVQRELKQQQEAIKKENERRQKKLEEDATSGINMFEVNGKELEELKKKFDSSRDKKILAMERVEYAANLDIDTPHDVRVSTLVVNRYIASMRCLSVHVRLSFFELFVQMKVTRNQVETAALVQLSRQSGGEPVGRSTIDIHPSVLALDAQEDKAVKELMIKLETEFENACMIVDNTREQWLKDPAQVTVEAEIVRLRTECGTTFSQYRKRQQKVSAAYSSCFAEENKFREILLEQRQNEQGLPDHLVEELLVSMRKEADMAQKIMEQDISETGRRISAEEFYLGYILNLCDTWGPKVDFKALQRQLFERILYNKQNFCDVHRRLSIQELHLKNELKCISVESDMNKRGADKKEVESTMQNLEDSAKESISLLELQLETNRVAVRDDELKRQDESYVGFEKERAHAITEDAFNYLRTRVDMDKSKRKVTTMVRETMANKHADTMVMLDKQSLSDVTKQLAFKQIQHECFREELELRAAYAVLAGETGFMLRYSTEVCEGILPSTDLSEMQIIGYHHEEFGLLKEALVYDVTRRTLKKRFTASRVKELEQMRIMSLGRQVSDLDKVYSYLDTQLSEELDLIDHDFFNQAKSLEIEQNASLKKDESLHTVFHDEVYVINSDYEHFMSDNTVHFQELLGELSSKKNAEKEELELNQEFAASIASINLDKVSKVYQAFKEYKSKYNTYEKVEDSLRTVTQHLQQKTEAMENMLENEKIIKYRGLLEAQILSRSQAMALKNEYEMSVNGLQQFMENKKNQNANFLKERLAKKKKAQEQKLIEDGMSNAEAAQTAKLQIDDELSKGMKDLDKLAEDDMKQVKSDLAADYEAKQKVITAEYKLSKNIADEGLEELKKKEADNLKRRMRAKKEKLFKELSAAGMSEVEAKKAVHNETKAEEAELKAALETRVSKARGATVDNLDQMKNALVKHRKRARQAAEADIENDTSMDAASKEKSLHKIELDFNVDVEAIKRQHDTALAIMEEGAKATQDKGKKSLLARLAKKHQQREQELEADGMSKDDAKSIADSELADETVAAKKQMDADIDIAKATINAVCADDAQGKLAKLKKEHEDKIKGMQNALDTHHKVESKLLKERLARKKALREKMMQEKGMAKEDIDAQLDIEFAEEIAAMSEDAIKQKVADDIDSSLDTKRDAIERITKGLEVEKAKQDAQSDAAILNFIEKSTDDERDALEENENSSRARLDAIRAASESNSDSTNDTLNHLREEHEAAVNKLQEDFKVKKKNQESAMQKKLAERRAKRAQEVEKEVKAASPALSSAEVAEKVAATVQKEEKKAKSDMEAELKAQEEEALAELEKKRLETQRKIAAAEQQKAEAAAKRAEEQENDAQNKLDKLKAEQETEQKRLMEQMNSDRNANTKTLKQRLADKRAKKLKDMDAINATAAQRQAEEARLAEEEHNAMLEAERAAAEADAKALAKLLEKQKKAAEESAQALRKAEVEAAIAASKQAALDSMKETAQRQEDELLQRDLSRMKEKEKTESERQEKEHAQAHDAKKVKLEERIKAKREKKERELQDQESKKLAELAAKQAADAEVAERLGKEKMLWSEHLAEAQAKAKKAGLGVAETEEFCIKETIGKKIVSADHMSQCVERILAPRHGEEAAKLVQSNFEVRMEAIKEAVTTIVSEKNEKRISLMARLEADEVDEATRKAEHDTLDAQYQKMQLDAEQKATASLQQLGMKSQMDLHQKHLEEISKICMLHSDPETMAKLMESTGKSKIEEMAEYRAKLQDEQKAREENMQKEREAAESKMRADMEKHVAEMKAKLQAEAEAAEAEYEREKEKIDKAMQDRKKEMEAKKEAASRTGDVKEQERIKAAFEKEAAAALAALENDKDKKKSKLQERLAAKRKNQPIAEKKEEDAAALKEESVEPNEKQTWGDSIAVVQTMKKKQAEASTTSQAQTSPAVANSLSALEKKLATIETMLETLASRATTASVAAPAGAAPVSAITEAPKEVLAAGVVKPAKDEPAAGTALTLVADADLHIQQRARLEFGYRVADLMGFKDLNFAGASSLPNSSAVNNAFANSYYYDKDAKQLAIHTERLSSSGDFGLIVIHALSHIKVNPGNLSNDMDPAFTSEFYSNLKILSQDLYKYSSTAVAKQIGSDSSKRFQRSNSRNSAAAAADALPQKGLSRQMTKKLTSFTGSLKEDELNESKESAANSTSSPGVAASEGKDSRDTYFSSRSITDRLKKYAMATEGKDIPLEYFDRYIKGQKKTAENAGVGDEIS